MTTTAPTKPQSSADGVVKVAFHYEASDAEALEDFRRKEGLRSIAAACRELIRRGFAASN
jgi:hypothetical protein